MIVFPSWWKAGKKLAAAASQEKDTVKLRFLINQLIHGPLPRAEATPNGNRGTHQASRAGHGKERFRLLHPVGLFVMPSNETLDDGKEACDSFVLADETVCVAHYVRHHPRIEDKGHTRLDCFQLVSECDACRST